MNQKCSFKNYSTKNPDHSFCSINVVTSVHRYDVLLIILPMTPHSQRSGYGKKICPSGVRLYFGLAKHYQKLHMISNTKSNRTIVQRCDGRKICRCLGCLVLYCRPFKNSEQLPIYYLVCTLPCNTE